MKEKFQFFKKVILLTLLLAVFFIGKTYAQNNSSLETTSFKGTVIEITQKGHEEFGETYQKLSIELEDGQKIEVENNPQMSARSIAYEKGDRVVLQRFPLGGNQEYGYIITDFQRAKYLTFLFLIFVVAVIIIGKKYGVYSLVGMGLSFVVIFKFILPQIIMGRNPIIITSLATILIIPVTFYLSHGFNKKTHTAIVGTIITLLITIALTSITATLAKLTGYSSDEAMFLQIAKQDINMKGVLLAGIIIGFLGVLDDVTVSQASIVMQLKKSKRNYDSVELYEDAMNVGRDHITSMINTLILVYTGASMPLLLLFINNPQPFMDIINVELIADEIIRTLVGSIGLILAVPLTTFIAAVVADIE